MSEPKCGVIRIKNWTKFQHYRDRKPLWIKLHRELMDDYDFQQLSDGSRALAPMLWLLASEYTNGEIPYDPAMICWRMHYAPEKLAKCLDELKLHGFAEFDSSVLATCYQDAPLEEKRREEKEKKDFVAGPQKSQRATQIPEGFSLTGEMRHHAERRGLDPIEELAAFTDHHKAKGTSFKDWQAAWRTWCRNAVRFKQRGGAANGAGKANHRERTARTLAEAREMLAGFGTGTDQVRHTLPTGDH